MDGSLLRGVRRIGARILPGVVLASLVGMVCPGAAEVTPSASSEALEQRLQNALATNEALKERIKKLEEMLKRDVCADPAAAEALLNEKVPAP